MSEERNILKTLASVQGIISVHDGVASLPDGTTLELRDVAGLTPKPSYHGKDRVEPGASGDIYTMDGERVRGTLETIPGTANVTRATRKPDGTLVVEWEGYTDVDWAGQRTQHRANGDKLYVTEGGDTVRESELVLIPEGESFEPEQSSA